MGTWTNDDGLYLRFGVDEATVTEGGTLPPNGDMQVAEVKITAADIAATAAIVANGVLIPEGARIHKCVAIVVTALDSAGDAATLNVGLVDQDRSTEIDYNGFVTAGAEATFDTAGKIVEYTQGSTAHGALIGTTLSNAGLITMDYDTEPFTAGELIFRVEYFVPRPTP